ncbi:hypothetical protein [Oceanispirochaeta sp. M1]|uniref:hypothetical protein n=2 Tax=Oceanispirochaeta TaxID=2035349 RepID=UPI00149528B5|nr:hypothetical protein [Oceanispirochaeta sp. M1]
MIGEYSSEYLYSDRVVKTEMINSAVIGIMEKKDVGVLLENIISAAFGIFLLSILIKISAFDDFNGFIDKCFEKAMIAASDSGVFESSIDSMKL